MDGSGWTSPVPVAVELMTVWLGPEPPDQRMEHLQRVKDDEGGDWIAILGLLELCARTINLLAQDRNQDPKAFAQVYLRAMSLATQSEEDQE
jgi:hypothetical protein